MSEEREKVSRAEAARLTQESVLDAAVELFVSQGYKQTSMEQISEAAGVAKGTIYIYYKSKRALFRAVCQLSVDQFVARIDGLMGSQEFGRELERLEAVLLAKFMYFHDLVSGYAHSMALLRKGREIGEDIYAKGDDAFFERVLEVVERALAAGECEVEAHGETARGLAELLIAACHGVLESLPSEEYEQQLRRMIAALLRGHPPI